MTELMRRRRALMGVGGGASPKLPEDYQEVEFIESTGTQWISTDVVTVGAKLPGYSLAFAFSFPNTAPQRESVIVGTDAVGGYYIGRRKGGNIGFTDAAAIALASDTKHIGHVKWDTSGMTFTCGGQSVTYSKYNISLSNRVFGVFSNASLYGGNIRYVFVGKIFSIALYYQNNPVFIGVPCYRKADGVIGMYDLVSETFKQNSGTGTFIKGADV